jgi:beta-glucosidase
MTVLQHAEEGSDLNVEGRVEQLLCQMTLTEKIGQMNQVNGPGGQLPGDFVQALRDGRIGSILNEIDLSTVNEIQRVVREESRLGIPLLIGRDVIHGFKTIFPIPLGLAASWNVEIVESAARISALEAASCGVNWTFAPMIDISRDPRWGRIAESFGEDPYLATEMGQASVKGFETDALYNAGSIAACAKHFVGYGASEGGRDYNTTNIPENELRNVHMKPFRKLAEMGVSTFMTSFGDLDGVPATGNRFLLKDVLREEWNYKGMVVSDWASVTELCTHGIAADDKEATLLAVNAGTNMEMASEAYVHHLQALVDEGSLEQEQIDNSVRFILALKYRLGLFDNPYTDSDDLPQVGSDASLLSSKKAAVQSMVLLKNQDQTLPLESEKLKTIALIGPLANEPVEQLGTWVFDGDSSMSQTPLDSICEYLEGKVTVTYESGLDSSRDKSLQGFSAAKNAAEGADVVLLFLGEEAILSGEAHCRADIGLPGAQDQLVSEIAELGKPVVAVVMAGRPLTIENLSHKVDAILYAWHPGTMAGPACVDILFGIESPSGKLPVTFPRSVGQIPIYYAHKNTGRPASHETVTHIDEIEVGAPQTSIGNTSFYLDDGSEPLYPFGYGLSYSEFRYENIHQSHSAFEIGESIEVSVDLTNLGSCTAEEIVQLYVRDLVANVTRPVRELKGFQKIQLHAGETKRVSFNLSSQELEFYGRDMKPQVEAGHFHVWVGGDSNADLWAEFELLEKSSL